MRKNNSAYYILSIFGFIPVIGIAIGTYLIFSGILKRNLVLKVLGVMNLLPQIWVVNVMIQNPITTKPFIKLTTENTINKLANIEEALMMYNVTHGEFPDSLNQVDIIRNVIINTDLTQTITDAKNKKFRYTKTKEGYILYSAGIDGIDKTDDDIFPVKK